MNNKFMLLLAVLLLAGTVIFFWPSDKKKISNNLDSLAEYCTSIHQEPVIEVLKKATLAAKLCSDPCKVQIESFKINHEFSQKEISDRIIMMKKKLSNTTFSFHDTVIDITDKNQAEVTTTLRINGKTVDDQFTDAYEINISAGKKDGDWRFSSFTVIEFMKK